MVRICLWILICGLFASTTAPPASAQGLAGTVGIPLHLCVLRDAPGLTAAHVLKTPAGFDCSTPQPKFGPGDYWVISHPLPAGLSHNRLMVRQASVWQQRMTLHALYPGGRIASLETDGKGATRHLQLGAIVERWLPRSDTRPVRLLWHVEGSANLRGIVIAPTIATSSQSARSNTIMSAVYAGFAGVCIALLLYNLGLARALRQAFFPFYCLMMVGMLLYAFSSSGALAWALPGIDNNARLGMNYVFLSATGVAAINFLRHFFEPHVISPRLGRMVRAASLAVALPAMGVALFAPWQRWAFDMAFMLGFVLLLATVVPILVSAWLRKSQYLWLFIVAWSVPIALAAMRVAFGLNLIGYHFWLDNSTILSMIFEALLSSLAIAYRILLITRERDVAREQEIAARLLADADPLTGLMNRRAFLREAIGREGEQQLLILDIDNFKGVNETIGHDGGDEVLRLVARILRIASHPQALVARIGGEEFAIVSGPGEPVDADHILAALRAARMPYDLTVTASVGLHRGTLQRETDWKAMYCAADFALFEAKAAGRDRVRGKDTPTFPSAIAA
ncbi:diguanylate cyclase [Sphingomonas sp. GB1N7]